jgi:hypothetical protein
MCAVQGEAEMSELFFGETTIRGLPISFAIDLEYGVMLGIHHKAMFGWNEIQLWSGPLVFTFTIYRRHA